jgi:hypothetical protein
MQRNVTRIAFPLSDWRTTSATLRGRNGDTLLPLNLRQIIVNLLHERVHVPIALFYISRLCSLGTNSVLRVGASQLAYLFTPHRLSRHYVLPMQEKGTVPGKLKRGRRVKNA